MRQDLGSGKPMLHYQEIPVFISDFVSDVEPVHQVHSTAVTIASMNVGASTVTLSADISAEVSAAISGIKAVADGLFLVARSGVAGKFRKFVLKITGIAGAVLTYDKTFKIKDDELNKLQLSTDSIMTPLAAGATGLIGKSAALFERVDGTSIYAGKFGEQEGFCAFTLMNNAGIQVKYVGPSREKDEQQYRMKWYVSAETYSRLALARLKSVLPL
jgi:hypothetical protein